MSVAQRTGTIVKCILASPSDQRISNVSQSRFSCAMLSTLSGRKWPATGRRITGQSGHGMLPATRVIYLYRYPNQKSKQGGGLLSNFRTNRFGRVVSFKLPLSQLLHFVRDHCSIRSDARSFLSNRFVPVTLPPHTLMYYD